ncbi:hypothetical protein ACFQ2B_07820 [Streptomyces stramineus]
MTGSDSSNSTQALWAKVSHLVVCSPSTRFSLPSPGPAFSPLARTAVTLSETPPGMPLVSLPSTPAARFLPSGPCSTVLRQSGCGSPGSKEEVKRSAGAPAGAAGADSAAAPAPPE